MKNRTAATLAGLLVALAGANPAAFAGEPKILARDKIWAHSRYNFDKAQIEIRHADYGHFQRWEVKIPNGGWQSCKGDCADYYRCEVLDFWECRSETGNGQKID